MIGDMKETDSTLSRFKGSVKNLTLGPVDARGTKPVM